MLDVIIGRHTWNCQIRTHIHTEIHTHTHTQKQKTQKKRRRCNDNQQTTVTHFVENKRLHLESSKQNYYIISLSVIIKAIFIHWKQNCRHMRTVTKMGFCESNAKKLVHVRIFTRIGRGGAC